MPWPLNWNGPFSCFGSFRGHSLPGPLTLHPPGLNTLTSVFGLLDSVGGAQCFWFSFLSALPQHSHPTLIIILKLFGLLWNVNHRADQAETQLRFSAWSAVWLFFAPLSSILRWSWTHIDVYRGVSALKCSFMFIGGSCSSFLQMYFYPFTQRI